MKVQYNLITIKLKIAISEPVVSSIHYKMLIKAFRNLIDLGILEVKYFDNKHIEKEIKE